MQQVLVPLPKADNILLSAFLSQPTGLEPLGGMVYYQFFSQAQSEVIEPSPLLFGRKRNKAWEKTMP